MLKLHSQLAEQNAVRNDAFNKFSENRFKKLSPIYYGYDELKKQSEKYTAVMVGSDQLWSPSGITSNFTILCLQATAAQKYHMQQASVFHRLSKDTIKFTKTFLTDLIM